MIWFFLPNLPSKLKYFVYLTAYSLFTAVFRRTNWGMLRAGLQACFKSGGRYWVVWYWFLLLLWEIRHSNLYSQEFNTHIWLKSSVITLDEWWIKSFKFIELYQTSVSELIIRPVWTCRKNANCPVALQMFIMRGEWGEGQFRDGRFFPTIQYGPGKKLELFNWKVPWSSKEVTGLVGESQGELQCQDKFYMNHQETAGSLLELDQVLQERASCLSRVGQW